MINWHHLFGLVLEDLFTGTGYDVEVEKNLSRKVQLLDIVIIRREQDSHLPSPLPDGLENLAAHNLLTYKSLHEPLDAWALDELTGHYVNYRKCLADPNSKKLPPEGDFQLYAVATRYPEKLAARIPLEPLCPGVYEVQWGLRYIRLIVPGKVSDTDANALWAMFSADSRRVFTGENRYHWHDPDKRFIVTDSLHETYRQERIDMAYTTEDFLNHWLQSLPPERRLQGLPPEERLKGLPPEERLKGLPPEERLKGLPPEARLKGLPPEARLKMIPPELLKALPEEAVKAWLADQEIKTRQ